MLTAKRIASHVRPLGYHLDVRQIPPPEGPAQIDGVVVGKSDRVYFEAKARGRSMGSGTGGPVRECTFQFGLPKPDSRGVYIVDDMPCMIVREGIVDYANMSVGQPARHLFRDHERLVCMRLTEALCRALGPFHLEGEPPADTHVQALVEASFKPSGRGGAEEGDPIRLVPESFIGREDLKSVVYVQPPDEPFDLTNRYFQPGWWKKLDPASTPQSSKVNIAFRMARGAKMFKSSIAPGQTPFCLTIDHYHGPVCYTPRRTHIARSAYCSTLPLVEPENPLVGNPGLPGRHLLTAIMNMPSYTGEDAIVVSETAAEKMTAVRHVRERFFLDNEFHLKVKEGDVVSTLDPIVELVDPERVKKWKQSIRRWETKHKKRSKLREKGPPKILRYAEKITQPATITRLSICPSTYMGVRMMRLTVDMEFHVALRDGDKVITRNAVKGVVRVIPDVRMPRMKDGRRVEILVSPESIVNRRAMGVYWEMMATAFAIDGGSVEPDHFDPRPTFPQLVAKGYGKKTQLSTKAGPLSEETYVGYLFMIRLDKLAAELVSACKGKIRYTGLKTPFNSARLSGQRRDLAKSQAMFARGLVRTFVEITERNIAGGYALREMLRVLGAKGFEPPEKKDDEQRHDIGTSDQLPAESQARDLP